MRIAIVGSGLSGLLVDVLARQALPGAEIVRFERASEEGGRARSPVLGDKPVNLGPRALYRGGPMERALRKAGVRPTGFVPPAQGALAIVDGDVRPLPASLGELLAEPSLDLRDKRSFALAQVRRAFTRGVLYVDGGWRSLVDALARAAGPATTRTIRSLDDVDADRVVVATAFDDARALVPALQRFAATPGTASCVDVVLRALPRPERRVAFGVGAPLYHSVHTRPGVAGPVVVHAMKNGAGTRAEVEGILDAVQPGWRDGVVEMRYLSRMVVASSLPLAGVGRPPVVDPLVDGRTLLVGDYVDAGALLADNVGASALLAVEHLAARARRAA
jgi:phytoene dehydrogenase-like protein